MQKPRRYERATLIADVTIGPGEEQPARFAAKMFNVSQAGAAVFSTLDFPVGKLVRMEMPLPHAPPGAPKVMLYGVIRRTTVRMDGNELGIEFVAGAADHGRFTRYLDQRGTRFSTTGKAGFTLVEACIAMVIICLLVTMATPIYSRAIEQARVDGAAGNLRVIWSAQRIYWLEHRTFATDLADLEAMDLVDRRLVTSASKPDASFIYLIVLASDDTFTAIARRSSSNTWVGQLVLDESGEITGVISSPGGPVITPPS